MYHAKRGLLSLFRNIQNKFSPTTRSVLVDFILTFLSTLLSLVPVPCCKMFASRLRVLCELYRLKDKKVIVLSHDDVIKSKHFPRNWPFVRGIHRSPVNSPHKGQKRGALMFSLIRTWLRGWVNNGDAGDLRRHRVHYDVTVMYVLRALDKFIVRQSCTPVQHPITDNWISLSLCIKIYHWILYVCKFGLYCNTMWHDAFFFKYIYSTYTCKCRCTNQWRIFICKG